MEDTIQCSSKHSIHGQICSHGLPPTSYRFTTKHRWTLRRVGFWLSRFSRTENCGSIRCQTRLVGSLRTSLTYRGFDTCKRRTRSWHLSRLARLRACLAKKQEGMLRASEQSLLKETRASMPKQIYSNILTT